LREREAEFSNWGLTVVVVTFAHDFLARSYVEDTALTWPLLIDGDRQVYRSYGMLNASFWDIWGPKTWLVYGRELLKGRKLEKSEDDIYQRGGDVLIDPDGVVRLHHVGDGPADRPEASQIFSIITTAGNTHA
jgi:alkyl hydroperoxide reductase subunit AhpC